MEFVDVPDDDIDQLLVDKKSSSSYQVPGTNKRVKYDPTIRTVANWFKLPHTMEGKCEMPNHEDGEKPPRLFFKLPDGRSICRHCFVEGKDLDENN